MDIFFKRDILYLYRCFVEVNVSFKFLLRSLYALEISQNPLIIKTGTNTVKSECF